jgi:iron complex transport system permease protein
VIGIIFLHSNDLTHIALGEEMALGHGVDVRIVQRDVFIGGGPLFIYLLISRIGK